MCGCCDRITCIMPYIHRHVASSIAYSLATMLPACMMYHVGCHVRAVSSLGHFKGAQPLSQVVVHTLLLPDLEQKLAVITNLLLAPERGVQEQHSPIWCTIVQQK